MLKRFNLLENCIYITLIGLLLIASNYVTISQFEGMVETAIEQKTTQIENNFNTKINKLKTRGNGTIDFTIDPVIDNIAQTNTNQDSIPKKEGFFKRLFGKKK